MSNPEKKPKKQTWKNRNFTKYFPALICNADILFETLQKNIEWRGEILKKIFVETEDTIAPARFVYIPELTNPRSFIDELIMTVVIRALYDAEIELKKPIEQNDIIVRYYRDGYHFFPTFSSKKHQTFVISLGGIRETLIGKNMYYFESGDCIIFGSPHYRIPVNYLVKDPYITIAVAL